MTKTIKLFQKYNFNFAWGKDGEELKALVERGMKRHNLTSAGEYIRHCIRIASQQEEKK